MREKAFARACGAKAFKKNRLTSPHSALRPTENVYGPGLAVAYGYSTRGTVRLPSGMRMMVGFSGR